MSGEKSTSDATAPPAGKLETIEAGRGLAALAVVLAHATSIMAEPRFFGELVFGGRLLPFGAGVDFFFVLSGFIISWVHWGDLGRPERLRRYAIRRFWRIYPSYWAVLLPLAALYFMFPGTGQPSQRDPLNLVLSAALLPYPEPPVLGVAWTLVHEIAFYLLFGLLILLGRAFLWVLPGWAALIVWAELHYGRLPFPLSVYLNAFNLEFLIGIGAAACLRHARIPAPLLVGVAGLLSFFALMLFPPSFMATSLFARLAYGAASFCGIVGFVEFERSRGVAVPAPLRQLGAASYAIYLVHGVALSASIHLVTKIVGRSLSLPVAFVALVIAATCVGLAYHRLIEQPLARLRPRGRQVPSADAATLPRAEQRLDSSRSGGPL